nr:TAXI family TRAP transporter solute-binding subunit [Pseudomonas sp. P818]
MRGITQSLARRSALFLVASAMALAAHAETIRIGAMPVGSGWYVAAAAMKKVLEENTALKAEVIARGGGVANPMVVQQGKAQIALSNVATSQWAVRGEQLYAGQKAPDIRSLVGGLNPVYIGAIVRNDYLRANGFTSLKEILESGKPVNIMMKPPGSNIPPALDAILEAHGTSVAKIKAAGGRILQIDSSQMAGMIRDGRADLYFDTILRGHPTVQEISLTGDVSFIDLSSEAIAALAKIAIVEGEIPKWFDIQQTSTVGGDYGTHLIAHKDLSDEAAYQITKAVVEHMDQLAAEFPAWQAFVREQAASPEKNGIALHPGAIRYYKEIDLL